jgi:hypothetical protein
MLAKSNWQGREKIGMGRSRPEESKGSKSESDFGCDLDTKKVKDQELSFVPSFAREVARE